MPRLSARLETARKPVKLGLGLLAFALLYFLAGFIPPGFDWNIFFGQRTAPSFYVPWIYWILPLLTWPLVVVLTLTALGWATWRRKGSPLAILLVICSLPVMWTLYLGQLDGLALLGLCLMPGAVPVALLKPQLTVFAMLSDRRRLVAALIWGIVSLAVWGGWPLAMLSRVNSDWQAVQPQDISLFPWSVPFVLPLLWWSRGDEDMLMAAGSLMTPVLIPYYFIVLMPGLARLSWPLQLLCWALSWLPFSANWLGPIGWHFGNVFSAVLWFCLWRSRKSPDSPPPDSHEHPQRQPGG